MTFADILTKIFGSPSMRVIPALGALACLSALSCSPGQNGPALGDVEHMGTRTQALTTNTIQGLVNQSDDVTPFTSPGSTISIRRLDASGNIVEYKESWKPGTFGGSGNMFTASTYTDGQVYEVGAMVPEGYTAFYSLCMNSTVHPSCAGGAWASYGPFFSTTPVTVKFTMPVGFVDLHFTFTKVSDPVYPVNQQLTCNVAGLSIPNYTTSHTFGWGNQGNINLLVSGYMGGIPTAAFLQGPAAQDSVNILDARSAGGASWQTSMMMMTTLDGVSKWLVTNMSAGNSGLQWGFLGTYSTLSSPDRILQTDWNPVYTDHISADNGGVPGAWLSNTLPCYHGGSSNGTTHEPFQNYYGEVNYTGANVSTAYGNVTKITNDYKVKARFNNSWGRFWADQAMYLRRDVARNGGSVGHNLRVVWKGAGDAWTEQWNNVADGFCPAQVPAHFSSCSNDSNLHYWATDAGNYLLDRIILIYTINGQDIGISIRRTDGRNVFAGFSLDKVIPGNPCNDPTDYTCGNLSLHVYPQDSGILGSPSSHALGSVTDLSLDYYVGTNAQLSELGYGW